MEPNATALDLVDGAVCAACDLTAQLQTEFAAFAVRLEACERRCRELAIASALGDGLPPAARRLRLEFAERSQQIAALANLLADIECAHTGRPSGDGQEKTREDEVAA
jgi:hypothetical protein